MSAPQDTPGRDGADLAKLWERTARRLADQGELSAQFQAWIALIRPLAVVEDTVLLAAPHDFAKDVLETRLRPALAAALAAELGRETRVAVTVEPPAEPPANPPSDFDHQAVAPDEAHAVDHTPDVRDLRDERDVPSRPAAPPHPQLGTGREVGGRREIGRAHV